MAFGVDLWTVAPDDITLGLKVSEQHSCYDELGTFADGLVLAAALRG